MDFAYGIIALILFALTFVAGAFLSAVFIKLVLWFLGGFGVHFNWVI